MIRALQLATLASITILSAPAGHLSAAEPLKLEDDTARINYSLGYQIGGDFKRQGVEMNPEAIIRGIEDALSGAEPLMPQQEMNTTLMELKRKVVAEQRTRAREAELESVARDKRFLEENATKPGVKTTASGLQYQVIEAGTGRTPKPTDRVTVNYRGTLPDGNEFDSSYRRGEPSTFQLDSVIKGWTEGLQLVQEGGKIQLAIPPELAYGGRGPLSHRTLVFDIELLSVDDGKPAGPAQGEQPERK